MSKNFSVLNGQAGLEQLHDGNILNTKPSDNMQETNTQTLSLPQYTIYIGDIWSAVSEMLKLHQFSTVVIVVDENTRQHCLPILLKKLSLQSARLIEVPSGELNKNIKSCEQIWRQMMQFGADRHSLCINLGGGVIGDMGGFCACTFKRGMTFIQMPTTLLSQVDASIGGKLGVDLGTAKNAVGLFCDPSAVMIFPGFLDTLPGRELRSGFAEMIKHSLIADAAQWARLQKLKSLENVDWPSYLLPSLQIKKEIVKADPFEKGIRKALNFGHTIGHAIEGAALHSSVPLLHGEAIAIGMFCEAWLSHQKLGLPHQELERICTFILQHYGKADLDFEQSGVWLELMRADKKNRGGSINFTLLSEIGKFKIDQICTADEILAAIFFYQNY